MYRLTRSGPFVRRLEVTNENFKGKLISDAFIGVCHIFLIVNSQRTRLVLLLYINRSSPLYKPLLLPNSNRFYLINSEN